jgi:hypothetical protein
MLTIELATIPSKGKEFDGATQGMNTTRKTTGTPTKPG